MPQKPGENKPDVPPNFVEVEFYKRANGEFDANATITFWVNPDKKVTVTAPTVTATEGFKHVAWTYKLTASATEDKEVKTLESVTDTFKAEKTTITAKYLKKVLDKEATEDQNAYVEVKFNAGTNGQLEGNISEKSYRVLKDTPITFDTPKVTPNDKYKFIGWDSEVKTAYSEDTEYNAQYKEIIVTKDPKEKDYVKVTFDPAAQGTIKAGSNAELWVLSGETIDPKDITPEIEAKTGYTFKEWDPVVQTSYTEDTKHTATYNYNVGDVVVQEPGKDKPNVPEDFVKVEFTKGAHGVISSDETTIYWVNPKATNITITAPKVTAYPDWKNTGWDSEVKTAYTEATTHVAQYKEIIVTEDPQDAAYAKVTFDTTAQGTIKGSAEVWVLKNETIDKSKITPEIEAKTGYTFKEWTPAVQTSYTEDTKHTATYNYNYNVGDVVAQVPGGDKPVVPDNYVEVQFKEGEHGTILGNQITIYWVNPKATNITIKAPTVTADPDWKNTGWDLEVKTSYNEATTHVAQYKKKVVTEDPQDTDYAKVTFKAGANGKLAGDKTETSVWVLKNTDVTLTEPDVIPNSGYKFTGWSPTVKSNYSGDEVHTAQYKETTKILGLPAIQVTIIRSVRKSKNLIFTTNPGRCKAIITIYYADGTEETIETTTGPAGTGSVILKKELQAEDYIVIKATRKLKPTDIPDYLDNSTSTVVY